MPNTIQITVGPLVSAPAVFATESAQVVGNVLRDFALAEDGLALPPESTNKEVLDACNAFAAQRFANYVRNWYRNRKRREAEAAIGLEHPLELGE